MVLLTSNECNPEARQTIRPGDGGAARGGCPEPRRAVLLTETRRWRGGPVTGPHGILPGVSDDTQDSPQARTGPAERPTTDPVEETSQPTAGSAAGTVSEPAVKAADDGVREPSSEVPPTSQQEEEPRDAVARARADMAVGREWKARERLLGHLAEGYDAQALELLGEVHYAMRDLPAAGAAWFGTNRRGADVDEAVAAWRERHGDHFPEMWRSLPRVVRDREGNKRVDALRRRMERDQPAAVSPAAPVEAGDSGGGMDAAVVIALVLAGLFVVFAVVGFVWFIGWLLPG